MLTNEMIIGYNYAVTDVLTMFADTEKISDEKLAELMDDSRGIVERGKKKIVRDAVTDYLRKKRKERIDG